MRGLAIALGALAAVALVLGGLAITAIGGFHLYEDHLVYKVGFKKSGDGCGSNEVTLSESSGDPLFCSLSPVIVGPRTAEFPGFTDAQNADVFSLAHKLAEDNSLSDDERQQIQDLVTKYAGTVPPQQRPQHSYWWGPRLLIGGVGAIGLGVLLGAGVRSRVR
jgi:hypothetical protein